MATHLPVNKVVCNRPRPALTSAHLALGVIILTAEISDLERHVIHGSISQRLRPSQSNAAYCWRWVSSRLGIGR